MAFTSTIKPYKFVNPSSISMKGGGATIIAGGKTITGGMTSQVKSARVTVLAINRIGQAMEGLGKTQQQIRDIIVYENKYLSQSTAFRRKRDQYRKDQKSEQQSESFGKKEQEDVAKEVQKKEKKKLGWLEKIFGPFAGIISFVGRFIITQTVLRWMGDPKNSDKLVVFVKSVGTVFKWAFNIAYKSTDAVLTGFAKVFGSSDKKGLNRFGEVLGGLGQLLIGIAGFKALGYLLNPFSLVNDIIGLIDMLSNRPSSGGGGGGGGSRKPQLGKGAQKVAENYGDDAARYYDDLIKRGKKPTDALKAVRGKFNKLPPPPKTLAGKIKQGISTRWDNLKFMAQKGVAGLKKFGMQAIDFGKGVWKKGANLTKNIGGWIQSSAGELKKIAAVAKDPEALKTLANKMVAEKVKPAIEKNPIIKKLVGIASNPKNLKDNVGTIIKDAAKSKQAKDLVKYLDEVKGSVKVTGLDKIISIIAALLDYGVGGTPMVNAFFGAIGGLLGYSGGFALGAPFGGFPGFITGVAGGFAGEYIGKQLAHLLAKSTPLGKTRDPFMNDGRMLADPELAEGGITTKPTRAWIGEKGPEVVLPLSKLGGGSGIASTLIGATQSALLRMGAAGEIAKSLIGGDLAAAENLFGVTAVGGAGGDTLGKSVNKGSIGGLQIDAGSDISLYLGDNKVIIADKKEPRNKPTTLRGQLANILSALIWVSNKEINGGGGGSTGGSGGDQSAAPGGPVEPLQVSGGQKGAFKKIYDISKQVGDPIPELTASQAMFESGWLTSLGARMDNNPFGQTGSGDAGKVWSNGRYWARYRNLNSAVKSHVDRWATGTPLGGPGYASKGGAPIPGLLAILEKYAPGSENNHTNYLSAVKRNLVTFGFDPNKKNKVKELARGGEVPPGIKDSSTGQLKKSEEHKLKVLKGEMIGGLVKFAAGGTFKNGQLPVSELQNIGKGEKLRKGPTAESFLQMAAAAKKDNIDLVSAITGSYRDLAGQEYMYATKPKGMAAKPGTSKHGWGVALDIGYANAQNWINKNGSKFGWGLPDWAKGGFEPWHFEKLGAATGVNSPTNQDNNSGSNTGSGSTEQPETYESLMQKLKSAVAGLNTSLGYTSPTDTTSDAKGKPGKTPPVPNTPAPSTPKPVAPAATAAASSSGQQMASTSEQVARLEEAAANSNQPAQIIPLPINSGMTQIAYGGTEVYTPRTPITFGI